MHTYVLNRKDIHSESHMQSVLVLFLLIHSKYPKKIVNAFKHIKFIKSGSDIFTTVSLSSLASVYLNCLWLTDWGEAKIK